MAKQMAKPRILLYILRRDVRLSDNPIFHRASLFSPTGYDTPDTHSREDSLISETDVPEFTHLLPVYVLPANQIEVSGFLSKASQHSPYPEARSQVAGVWRTGPHRANFIADGLWNLKENLEKLACGAGLEIRVGRIGEVVENILEWYAKTKDEAGNTKADVAGIWMTAEDGTEEYQDERDVREIAEQNSVDFQVWEDEKYYVDDRDLPFDRDQTSDLPNVYTSFRKSLEPLRERPRQILETPNKLPPLPPDIPPQMDPFEIPETLKAFRECLLAPLNRDPTFGLTSPPKWPGNVQSAHPFQGGESAAHDRVQHLITSGAMSSYKATRNGMLGLDFSTKLSAYLAQGHLTARQVHWAMVDFEEGNGQGKGVKGFGKGENDGTAAVRFELLWRDYMRLCARKFGARMFHVDGIRTGTPSKDRDHSSPREDRNRPPKKNWRYIDQKGGAGDNPAKTLEVFTRFRSGLTGIGLIDASNRELFLTGYTSNRARQNVASFLASHLGIDWRVGAEWYEFLLLDYDVGNNWGNWQYVAGVGNDPRQGRIFNPVKQALDYDAEGEYIKAWVPELRGVQLTKNVGSSKAEIDQQRLMGLFQAWRLDESQKEELGLRGLEWVDDPLVRIQFSVHRRKQPTNEKRGRDRGNRRGRNKGRDFRRTGHEDWSERGQSPSVNGA